MNAVAPLFVRGDNILSPPSVQWTVSCIRLTPRISISVNTRDNLDKRRRGAERACTSGKKGACFVVRYGFSGTLWQL